MSLLKVGSCYVIRGECGLGKSTAAMCDCVSLENGEWWMWLRIQVELDLQARLEDHWLRIPPRVRP